MLVPVYILMPTPLISKHSFSHFTGEEAKALRGYVTDSRAEIPTDILTSGTTPQSSASQFSTFSINIAYSGINSGSIYYTQAVHCPAKCCQRSHIQVPVARLSLSLWNCPTCAPSWKKTFFLPVCPFLHALCLSCVLPSNQTPTVVIIGFLFALRPSGFCL